MIVREARSLLVAAGVAAVLVHVAMGLLPGLLGWLGFGLLAWLFRDPPRRGSVHPLTLFSPIDGVVLAAGGMRDPYRDHAASCVVLRGAWTGPYLLRSPIEGQVADRWDAWHELPAGARRPGGALCVRTDEGDEVLLAYAPRVPILARLRIGQGDRVGHGQVIGLLPFGGLAAVYFDGHGRVRGVPGTSLKAGLDPVADLLHD